MDGFCRFRPSISVPPEITYSPKDDFLWRQLTLEASLPPTATVDIAMLGAFGETLLKILSLLMRGVLGVTVFHFRLGALDGQRLEGRLTGVEVRMASIVSAASRGWREAPSLA